MATFSNKTYPKRSNRKQGIIIHDYSQKVFCPQIYSQYVVLLLLCLSEKQRTTNQYSWQGIMPIYIVITTRKYIYIYIFHFGFHYVFFLLGCRHNRRFIFNINFDNSHFKTNIYIEKALFVIVVAISNYSENISWFILRK